MSGQSDWAKLNHTQQDIQKEIIKNRGLIHWLLIISSAGLLLGVINFILAAVK